MNKPPEPCRQYWTICQHPAFTSTFPKGQKKSGIGSRISMTFARSMQYAVGSKQKPWSPSITWALPISAYCLRLTAYSHGCFVDFVLSSVLICVSTS